MPRAARGCQYALLYCIRIVTFEFHQLVVVITCTFDVYDRLHISRMPSADLSRSVNWSLQSSQDCVHYLPRRIQAKLYT